jgi:putative inorganic carbon (hco3(-)) transporter
VTARLDWSNWMRGLALALVAAPLGVLAGYDPRLAIAAALAAAFVLVAFGDLAAGLALFAFLGFVEIVPLFGPVLNLTKLAGALLALSWFAVLASGRAREADFARVHPLITVALGLFLGWAAVSGVWAEEPGAALGSVSRYALNAVLFLIVFTAVRTKRDLGLVLLGFAAGTAFAAGYGMVTTPNAEAPDRLYSGQLDPNELAAALVAGVATSFAMMLLYRDKPLLLVLGVGTATLCAAGVLLTASRGALIALSVMLLFAIVISGRWRVWVVIVGVLFASVAYVYFAAYAPEAVRERIAEPASGQARVQEGRTTIWQVAWRAFEDKPVIGVGTGNFATSSKHYVFEPGALPRSDEIVDAQQVAHNSYLEVLAELGVIGMALFATIVAFSIGSVLRASREFRIAGDSRMQLVALCLAIAMVGHLAADFFFSAQYSKQLWLLLGLGPAMLTLANASRPSGSAEAAD